MISIKLMMKMNAMMLLEDQNMTSSRYNLRENLTKKYEVNGHLN